MQQELNELKNIPQEKTTDQLSKELKVLKDAQDLWQTRANNNREIELGFKYPTDFDKNYSDLSTRYRAMAAKYKNDIVNFKNKYNRSF